MYRQNNLLRLFSICCILFAIPSVVAQSIGQLKIINTCTTDANSTPREASVVVSGFPIGSEFTLVISNKNGSFNFGTLDLDTRATQEEGTTTINFSFSYPLNDGTGTPFGSDTYVAHAVYKPTGLDGLDSKRFSVYIFESSKQYVITPSNSCSITTLTVTPDDLPSYDWYLIDPVNGDLYQETTTTNTYTPQFSGRYYVKADIGSCDGQIAQAESINVAVLEDGESKNTIDFTISAEGNTTICAEDSVVLKSSVEDDSYAYQWFKDDQKIANQNASSITVSGIASEGSYRLDITNSEFGFDSPCRTSTSTNRIDVDLLNPTISLLPPYEIILVPNTPPTLTCEVSGNNTTITWLRNNVPIPDSNSTTLQVDREGTYKAQVTGTSICDQNTVISPEEIVVIPFNINSVLIRNIDPFYSDCGNDNVTLEVVSVESINNAGGISTITDKGVLSTLPISWQRASEIINGETSLELNITDASNNGLYKAVISGTESNEEEVILSLGTLTITSDNPENTIAVNGQIELSVQLPQISLTSVTYQWLRNGVEIAGETAPTLQISRSGRYSVIVNSSECDEATLNEIVIGAKSADIPNVVTPLLTNNKTWILPVEFISNDVNITIVDPYGKEVFNRNNYQNDWPLDSGQLEETIYYYIISRGSEELKKGTITILR